MTIHSKAAGIKLLLLDVDGVLTDGTVIVQSDGSESKPFAIRDGIALVWAQRVGLKVGILSARNSPTTTHRAAQLGITLIYQGVSSKADAYERILTDERLTDDEVAYMGDDIVDLAVLARVGLSTAPADAVAEVRARVALGQHLGRRTRRGAGNGRNGPPRPEPVGRHRRLVCDGGTAQMSSYAPLLAALVALLAGLTIGKAWERYKLRGGKWIDRRRARESPHYILGLNFLVSNQIDLAIEELSRAASLDADALEVHMILGNLYREKGQVGKAITVHQSLLQRAKLTRLEHAYVLLCLGLDYKRGGFVDRALEAFNEVMRLDPKNEYALLNLQKLHEEQHQWSEAYDTRQRLTKLTAIDSRPQSQSILAFLENEIGLEAMRRKDYAEAARRFQGAIDIDARAVPAYLNLGDVRVAEGKDKEAAGIWEELVHLAPDRAYLAFDRLEALAVRTGNPERFTRLCRRLIDENPQDWRGRLALSRHFAAKRPDPRSARLPVRGVEAESARAQHPPGDLAGARPAAPSGRARQPLRRADPACGVLPRSARLRPLPLPQHRAALAVSALPRLEHVCRRAHRAGAGHDGSGGLRTIGITDERITGTFTVDVHGDDHGASTFCVLRSTFCVRRSTRSARSVDSRVQRTENGRTDERRTRTQNAERRTENDVDSPLRAIPECSERSRQPAFRCRRTSRWCR